jgi:hypothetical protein
MSRGIISHCEATSLTLARNAFDAADAYRANGFALLQKCVEEIEPRHTKSYPPVSLIDIRSRRELYNALVTLYTQLPPRYAGHYVVSDPEGRVSPTIVLAEIHAPYKTIQVAIDDVMRTMT